MKWLSWALGVAVLIAMGCADVPATEISEAEAFPGILGEENPGVSETLLVSLHDCYGACDAGHLLFWQYCHNDYQVPRKLQGKCGKAARAAHVACQATKPDGKCEGPCSTHNLLFQMFCRDNREKLTDEQREACWRTSMAAHSACVAKAPSL